MPRRGCARAIAWRCGDRAVAAAVVTEEVAARREAFLARMDGGGAAAAGGGVEGGLADSLRRRQVECYDRE